MKQISWLASQVYLYSFLGLFIYVVIMSDAVHWLATQPLTFTGEIKTIADLRKLGVVRSQTRWESSA